MTGSRRSARRRPRHQLAIAALAGAAAVSACTTTAETAPVNDVGGAAAGIDNTASATITTIPTASFPPATINATPSTTTTTTIPPTTTTTTIPEVLDVFDPNCVTLVETGGSLEAVGIASGIDDPTGLWFENGEVDAVAPGDLIDICVDNGVDDIDGQPRPPIDDAARGAALAANVERQQSKLNELFSGYGTPDLSVDGVSGPRTGQSLCAARLALGLDTTIADMAPGSTEQATLLASTSIPTPDSPAVESERWVLIDRTCQMMFIGADTQTVFVFPTSTGSEGYETRDQDSAEAFRFNPALENGGWHNSSEFPVGVDNPLNGNLYKPLYFDLGQAIHGANNVPPTPESKGCARLRVEDQNTFIAWLGLDTATGETWRKAELNVTVTVQGNFVPR